jgi:hypothetical protein
MKPKTVVSTPRSTRGDSGASGERSGAEKEAGEDALSTPSEGALSMRMTTSSETPRAREHASVAAQRVARSRSCG